MHLLMACITLLFMHLLSQPLQLTQQLLLLLNVSTAYKLFARCRQQRQRKAAAVVHLNSQDEMPKAGAAAMAAAVLAYPAV